MATVFLLNICLVLILSRVDSCSIPNSLHLKVPQIMPSGFFVTAVSSCPNSMQFNSTDHHFTITNGHLITTDMVSLRPGQERTFYVVVLDASGQQSEIEVHLVSTRVLKQQPTGEIYLRRSKRRWSPPPFNILENEKGPFPRDIEKIVSDSEQNFQVYYTFEGPGFDQNPVGVFTLDRYSGMLTVHKAVDREAFPSFTLTVKVFDRTTNQPTDAPLPIKIIVNDVNDNAPTFTGRLECTVLEQSKAGSEVGKLNATDRDEQGIHTQIRYKLLTGLDLFAIHPSTGVITTKTNTLDRETKDKYAVQVEIKDMDGAVTGLSNTGTATITVGDINDNPPTFTQASYTASVTENESNKLLLRIPIEDKDLVNTDNWISKFVITKGAKKDHFRIDTDPETNEGLLYVTKPLDFEDGGKVNLEIMARNKADLVGTSAQWVSVPLEVSVTNVDEGPEFTAPTVRFNVKENTPNGTLIGTYKAVDPETKSSNGISYYKTTDPASWINFDKNTGELKVANTIDRESHFVQDGIYNITVKAVDASSKTGTGTVMIVVEDENDNVPTPSVSDHVVCEKEGVLGSVLVGAEDPDQSPFSSPFTFSLPDDHDGKWSLAPYNDTAVMVKHSKELPTGLYQVPIVMSDLQGKSKTQTVNVRICQCRNGACLPKDSSVSLGPMALLAMLLPLLLLLLLCALLAFFCMTGTEHKPLPEDIIDGGGHLLPSNTEAPGDEVDPSLINVPIAPPEQITKGSIKGTMTNPGWPGQMSSSTIGIMDTGLYKSGVMTDQEIYRGQYDSQYGTRQLNEGQLVDIDNRYLTQNSSLLHTWQTNGRYLQQKLAYMGTEEDGRYADDIIHDYGFEGKGSAAGSVGCCSDFGDGDNLDFLNTLGPKFKTLADVCKKT